MYSQKKPEPIQRLLSDPKPKALPKPTRPISIFNPAVSSSPKPTYPIPIFTTTESVSNVPKKKDVPEPEKLDSDSDSDSELKVEKTSRFPSFRRRFTAGRENLRTKRLELWKKNVPIFGNELCNLPKYCADSMNSDKNRNAMQELEAGIPDIVVRCLKRIETMKTFDGLYRINGDAEEVKKLK